MSSSRGWINRQRHVGASMLGPVMAMANIAPALGDAALTRGDLAQLRERLSSSS
jgi:hypothetical protein